MLVINLCCVSYSVEYADGLCEHRPIFDTCWLLSHQSQMWR
jgi:hypothetical protein